LHKNLTFLTFDKLFYRLNTNLTDKIPKNLTKNILQK